MTRKLLTGIVSATLALSMTPVFALAQAPSTVQVRLDAIAALQAQIKALQEQLQGVQGQKTEAVAELTSLLRQGARGDQVSILQALLAADSSIYPEGLITGYFGPATANAVKRFQKARGLEQVGNVGPLTLGELKRKLQDNPIAFSNATSTGASGNQGQGKRLCAIVPPGHLIAPGWLKKQGGVLPIVPTCQTLPPGIWGKVTGSTTPGQSDKTAPVISTVVANPGLTSATVTWTTNELSNSKVLFGTTTAYGSTATNASFVTGHSVPLSGLTGSTLYHFRVESTDASGNTATSSDMTFTTGTPDTTAPAISGISILIGSTTSTVLWSTNESATGKVYFGTATPFVLGSASSVSTSTLSTGHSLSLTGLTASTTYSYVIESADSSGNTATTSAITFNTSN